MDWYISSGQRYTSSKYTAGISVNRIIKKYINLIVISMGKGEFKLHPILTPPYPTPYKMQHHLVIVIVKAPALLHPTPP